MTKSLATLQLALTLSALTSASALHAAPTPAPSLDEDSYAKVYPEYAEFCGLSQIKKNPGFGLPVEGGTGGHGVLYVNGACLDRSSPYPKIKVCEASDTGEHGVGISVNSDYRNVNWTAVEGKQFFYYGNLRADETLNRTTYQRSMDEALARNIMKGIDFHEELYQSALPGMTHEQYKYEDSIGTDFAISFGRNMYCARTPLQHSQVGEVVAYLNELNRHYHDDGVVYVWDVFKNNCTHSTHNALANAGIWRFLAVDQPILFQLHDLAIPVNTFALLMGRTNELPLNRLVTLYQDEVARKSLMEKGWLPTQPGGLAQFIPVHQSNELYNLDLGSMIIDWPLLNLVHNDIDDYLHEPRFTDLKSNLAYFRDLYSRLLRTRHEPFWYIGEIETVNSTSPNKIDPADFNRFHAKFYVYIEQQLADVQAKLLSL